MNFKISKIIFLLLATAFLSTVLVAQDSTNATTNKSEKDNKEHSKTFVDSDGDGYNDNAPDHDGDGIPNGLDSDYIKMKKNHSNEYVDMDGDGINDNMMMQGGKSERMYRYQGGELNLKPQDGSGQQNNGSAQDKGKGKGKGSGNGRGGG